MKLAATLICSGLAIAATLGADVTTLGGYKVEANKVIVRRKAGPERLQAFRAQQATVEHQSAEVPGLSVLRKDAGARLTGLSQAGKAQALENWITELRASGDFEYVEPSFIYDLALAPNDTAFVDGTLWGLRNLGLAGGRTGADINAAGAWEYATGSTNVTVAIIDTGVRYTHQELAPQMWRNPGEIPGNGIDDDRNGYVDDVYGINALDENGDPQDDDGHGTHIAGTIGAAANDGNPLVGVAWNVRLMALRAGNTEGLPSSAIIKCLEYAGDHGAKIINASFGGYGFSRAQYDVANSLRAKGILLVASAGNENNDNDARPSYPASFDLDNVLSVAALDRQGRLASFSNFGRDSVQIAAPGVDIFSTYFGSDTDYAVLEGTSMAAPHVSGVAALIAGYIRGASYSELRARILDSANRDALLAGKVSAGALDAFRALTRGVDGVMEYSIVPADNSAITVGEPALVSVSLSDGPSISGASVTLNADGLVLPLRYDDNPQSRTGGAYTNVLLPTRSGLLSFSLKASAPGKSNLVQSVSFLGVNRPANDRFASFIKVPSQEWTQTTSNRFATSDGPAEDRLGHGGVPTATSSIWYAFSTPSAGTVLVDTAGSTFDTVISVYRGSSLESLVEVAHANDVGSRKAAWLLFSAEANVSYKVAIAGVPPNDEGMVRVRFALNGAPDESPPVVLITDPASGITVGDSKIDVRGVAFDAGPNASGIEDASVQYSVSTNRFGERNDLPRSAQGTTNWLAPVDLAPGVNYITIWAFDHAQNRSRAQQISILYRPAPVPYDLFADAMLLPGTQGSVTNLNSRASRQVGEPAHAGNSGGHSLWHKFIPTESGVVLLNTRGSTTDTDGQPMDTVMGVYIGTSQPEGVSALENLASNDDAVGEKYSETAVAVRAGETYYIAIDGYDGATGSIHLNYAFRASLVYRLSTATSVGTGIVVPRSGLYPANASVSLVGLPGPREVLDRFEVNGLVVRGNPATIALTSDTTVHAFFSPQPFAEDFQTLPLQQAISATNWSVAVDPKNALNQVFESVGNGADAITNVASLVVNTSGGSAGFDFGTSTEPFYDRLEFYITSLRAGHPTNTYFLGSWSGDSRDRYEFELPAGLVRLEWWYVKDRAISRGGDLVFIDNLSIPLAAVEPLITVDDQRSTLRVMGAPGQNYIFERSTDLFTWSERELVTAAADGELKLEEPVKSARRFYRLTPVSAAH